MDVFIHHPLNSLLKAAFCWSWQHKMSPRTEESSNSQRQPRKLYHTHSTVFCPNPAWMSFWSHPWLSAKRRWDFVPFLSFQLAVPHTLINYNTSLMLWDSRALYKLHILARAASWVDFSDETFIACSGFRDYLWEGIKHICHLSSTPHFLSSLERRRKPASPMGNLLLFPWYGRGRTTCLNFGGFNIG